MLKKILSIIVVFIVGLSINSVAQAHVTLNPNTSEPGSYEKYEVRVPVEKDAHTTKIELEVPKEVEVVGIQPNHLFDYDLKKDSKGNIKKITWKAKKDGIGPSEFIDLPIEVANPKKEGEFKWNAFQTYDNGEVVKWTGNKNAETPAPITTVKKGITQEAHGVKEESKQDHAPLSLWIVSIIAILLSLVALFKKSRNK
ncbi:YcnI family protein [Staphylococcus sp. SQ8-PEA]|uniref:YcnI family protein n=1 Tax=Staphylococcus marylandisciuri TaxID=2981529 RepID=A0ABT2QMR9_9STAP|nr:YcnI family protein [Staphylococcus marylandisciuri]MCU5745274.1 YcnI family protein [Staphylococcus marylandisciuri]